tara:strand:- start:125 stop:628 length:504 start_codon:yes stop_codon:yes gene_type:complete
MEKKLKPYTQEVKGFVYDDYEDEIVICPNELNNILQNMDNLILPEGWELTQETFDSLMNYVWGMSRGDEVFEGDSYELEEFISDLKNGDDGELNYTNQEFVFHGMLKWSLLTKLDFNTETYWTISEEYGGEGVKCIIDDLSDKIQSQIDEYSQQLNMLNKVREKEVN